MKQVNPTMVKEGKVKEMDLYPKVAKFVREEFNCIGFADRPTYSQHAAIDVLGLTQSVGKEAGDFEVIAVEVKLSTSRFLTSAGQTLGYSIMADRCYLAIWEGTKELVGRVGRELAELAAQLNIGLISIDSRECHILLTSPKHRPLRARKLALVYELGFVECTLCRNLYKRDSGHVKEKEGTIQDAAEQHKGFRYRLESANQGAANAVPQRRTLCRDCVRTLTGHSEQH